MLIPNYKNVFSILGVMHNWGGDIVRIPVTLLLSIVNFCSCVQVK